MPGLDLLRLDDGGEVHALVPIGEGLVVELKALDLTGAQLDAEVCGAPLQEIHNLSLPLSSLSDAELRRSWRPHRHGATPGELYHRAP